jgi:plasmid replication initiation protein
MTTPPSELKINPYVETYSVEEQNDIYGYLNQLDELNKQAYTIAFDHLKSSFNISRSNGYKHWKQVLTFLREQDDETKQSFHYNNDYAFDCDTISESDLYKKWVKSKG